MANFDTLSFLTRLKAQGFTEEQARALVYEFCYFLGDDELQASAISHWKKLEEEHDGYPLVPRDANT